MCPQVEILQGRVPFINQFDKKASSIEISENKSAKAMRFDALVLCTNYYLLSQL
jgi:hypothetical protein